MRYPLILGHLMSRPWAMRPDTMQAFAHVLHAAELGGHANVQLVPPAATTDQIDRRSMRWVYRDQRGVMSQELVTYKNRDQGAPAKSIAVIPMHGIIAKYLDRANCEPGFDLQDFDAELMMAANDPNVTEIVIHAHTPGGSCTGVAEESNRIAQVAGVKPVYTYSDSECCSAGYWQCCSGTAFFASEMACIGSIGVYLAWIDQAKWLEANGYELKLFKAGTFKAATLPGQLTDEAGQRLQDEVDSIAQSFYSWVRARRALNGVTVADETMQGQTFLGRDALKVGLVDGLYNNINDLLTELLNS